jgi:outer membrane protein TolC
MRARVGCAWALVAAMALRATPVGAQDRATPVGAVALSEAEVERRVRATGASALAQRSSARAAEVERERALRGLVPELAVSARYTRLSSVPEQFRRLELSVPGAPMMDPLVFPQLLDQFAARATVTFSLSDVFMRGLPALSAATSRAEAARFDAEAVEARAVLDAQTAYLGWLRARAALAIARSTRESFEQQRDDLARRVTAGQVALSQRLPLDVTLSSLRRQEAALEASVRGAELSLRAQLSLGAVAISAADEQDEPSSLEGMTGEARRAELAALDANGRALDAQRTATRGAMIPSVAVVAGVDFAAPNPRAFAQTTLAPLATWDLTVQVSWSLGQTLDAEAAARALSHQREALSHQREALSRAIDAEVGAARAELLACRRRIEAAREGLASAEALAAQRRGAFAAGAATATELTIAEAELFRQRIEREDARLEARAIAARLRFALGAQRVTERAGR